MSIFKFNKKAGNKRKPIELAFDKLDKTALAFGLQWRSIVTSDARRAGIAIARAQGATHVLFRGQQVGFGIIDAKANPQLSSGAVVYPAALVVARQYGGDAIFVLNVSKGDYWIALIRNGSPTSSDSVLLNSNDSEAIAEAKNLLTSVAGDDARVIVYTNIQDHGLPGTVRNASLEDILLAATHDDDRISVMPKAGTSIPKPVLVVLCIGTIALAGQQGYKSWEAKQRASLAAQNRVQHEDPAVTWARVIEAWEATKAAPNSGGLLAARESMGRLPVLWNGWTLTAAKCAASPLSSPAIVRTWSCSAMYERASAGGKVNREMVSLVPKDWIVSFLPLKGMQLSWSFEQPIIALKIAGLKPTSFHSIETTSRFQAIAPAFSQDVKFAFVPVSIPAPKAEDGTALPPDPVASALRESVLSMRGPLRTIDALIDRDIPADWDSLGITFAVNSSIQSVSSSSISAEVTGVIYAKD